jgi:serine/threonine-protein phosphatase 5
MQILKPQSAVADFRKVLAIEPKNETVRGQLLATQKLIRKIEFEKVRGRSACCTFLFC